MLRHWKPACAAAILMLLSASVHAADVQKLFTGSESRPADAIVLFEGKDLSNWVYAGSDRQAKWIVKDGYMQIRGGNICTKRHFADCQLHIEFWLPLMENAKGQDRANSGVYLQGRYEVQVLDSYGLKSGGGDCGAIYGVAAPMVNACRPPEHWQSYDIIFRAPKFDDKGEQIVNPRMTIFHNGVLIHENVEIPSTTRSGMSGKPTDGGPILIQDHGAPVRYRNIWLRPLGEDGK